MIRQVTIVVWKVIGQWELYSNHVTTDFVGYESNSKVCKCKVSQGWRITTIMVIASRDNLLLTLLGVCLGDTQKRRLQHSGHYNDTAVQARLSS